MKIDGFQRHKDHDESTLSQVSVEPIHHQYETTKQRFDYASSAESERLRGLAESLNQKIAGFRERMPIEVATGTPIGKHIMTMEFRHDDHGLYLWSETPAEHQLFYQIKALKSGTPADGVFYRKHCNGIHGPCLLESGLQETKFYILGMPDFDEWLEIKYGGFCHKEESKASDDSTPAQRPENLQVLSGGYKHVGGFDVQLSKSRQMLGTKYPGVPMAELLRHCEFVESENGDTILSLGLMSETMATKLLSTHIHKPSAVRLNDGRLGYKLSLLHAIHLVRWIEHRLLGEFVTSYPGLNQPTLCARILQEYAKDDLTADPGNLNEELQPAALEDGKLQFKSKQSAIRAYVVSDKLNPPVHNAAADVWEIDGSALSLENQTQVVQAVNYWSSNHVLPQTFQNIDDVVNRMVDIGEVDSKSESVAERFDLTSKDLAEIWQEANIVAENNTSIFVAAPLKSASWRFLQSVVPEVLIQQGVFAQDGRRGIIEVNQQHIPRMLYAAERL